MPELNWPPAVVAPRDLQTQIVRPGESIAAALERAQPGGEIFVEPGEYRERVRLTRNVHLISRTPRGATIRLPATASDTNPDPAVIATGSASGR